MIFSPVPAILKRWLCSNWIPLALFLVLLSHGAVLGLTDDEAYYWALAQRPGLGFAYHPPGVVWAIAFFQFFFGWLGPSAAAAVVRMPAAFFSAGIVALALAWIREHRQGDVSIGRGAVASASRMRAIAAARSSPWAISLAIIES